MGEPDEKNGFIISLKCVRPRTAIAAGGVMLFARCDFDGAWRALAEDRVVQVHDGRVDLVLDELLAGEFAQAEARHVLLAVQLRGGSGPLLLRELESEGVRLVVAAHVLRLLLAVAPHVLVAAHVLEACRVDDEAGLALEAAEHGFDPRLAGEPPSADDPEPLHGQNGPFGEEDGLALPVDDDGVRARDHEARDRRRVDLRRQIAALDAVVRVLAVECRFVSGKSDAGLHEIPRGILAPGSGTQLRTLPKNTPCVNLFLAMLFVLFFKVIYPHPVGRLSS